MFSSLIIVLFCFNIINRILRSSAPALDDNGEQGNDEADKPSSSEDPRAERDAITEVAEPVVHDVPRDGHSNDKRNQHRDGERAEHQQQHLARCRAHHFADGNLLAALTDEEERQPHVAHDRDNDGNEGEEGDNIKRILTCLSPFVFTR